MARNSSGSVLSKILHGLIACDRTCQNSVISARTTSILSAITLPISVFLNHTPYCSLMHLHEHESPEDHGRLFHVHLVCGRCVRTSSKHRSIQVTMRFDAREEPSTPAAEDHLMRHSTMFCGTETLMYLSWRFHVGVYVPYQRRWVRQEHISRAGESYKFRWQPSPGSRSRGCTSRRRLICQM